MSDTPIKRFRFGKIQIALWENAYEGKKTCSFTIQKNYKAKDGEWKRTGNFTSVDLRDINVAITRILGNAVISEKVEPKTEQREPEHSQPPETQGDEVPY